MSTLPATPLTLATWNVNSVKARRDHLLRWLGEARPDLVALQELKGVEADFPADALREAGYASAAVGQKTYNGVAILARIDTTGGEIAVHHRALPGDEADEQARYLEADIAGLRFIALYLPNGNPTYEADGATWSEKYRYKHAWMARLRARAAALLREEIPFVLAGDFNIIPAPEDVYDPAGWAEDALFKLDSRQAFRSLMNLGLTDAFRQCHPRRAHAYSFWDYQQGAWPRDNGLRIDHLLLSPQLADRLEAADIDKGPRGWDKASDHTPVWCRLRPEMR